MSARSTRVTVTSATMFAAPSSAPSPSPSDDFLEQEGKSNRLRARVRKHKIVRSGLVVRASRPLWRERLAPACRKLNRTSAKEVHDDCRRGAKVRGQDARATAGETPALPPAAGFSRFHHGRAGPWVGLAGASSGPTCPVSKCI